MENKGKEDCFTEGRRHVSGGQGVILMSLTRSTRCATGISRFESTSAVKRIGNRPKRELKNGTLRRGAHKEGG